MRKLLLVLVMVVLLAGCEKPIDKIYVEVTRYGWFQESTNWQVVDVMEKKGNMWRTKVFGETAWLNAETTIWKPFYEPNQELQIVNVSIKSLPSGEYKFSIDDKKVLIYQKGDFLPCKTYGADVMIKGE